VTIRVAYDISFLGKFFNRPDEQSGVFRVAEELLRALAERNDVKVTPTAICGDDPLADSINAQLYVERRARNLSDDFKHSFRSSLKLGRLYANVSYPFASGEIESLRPYSPRAIWLRRMRGLLHRIAYKYRIDDLRHVLPPGQFDLFHSPFSPLPAHQLTAGLRRVLTIYDLIFLHQPNFMTSEINSLMRRVFDSIDTENDWFTAISQFTKDEFCEFTGVAPERVQVTPLAAAQHFQPVNDPAQINATRARYGIPEGDYLLSLAAIQPRKNLAHLIRCFLRLLAERPSLEANLILVGKPSWIFDDVFSVVDSTTQRRGKVLFTGYVLDEDLSSIYSGASAFVFPSLYEGFGLPPLEAMQCGTPVVTSNNTAFPEVIGDAGLMIDPKDEDGLCQAMLDVITDGNLRRQLSAKGLERAKQFSWANCAEQTVTLYRKAIG
jgi:glycosyltransferase involved in cell wall biosynthesis